MEYLIDTSAFLALLDRRDTNHERARTWFAGHTADAGLTHSYCIVETAALVQRRLKSTAAQSFLTSLLPAMTVVYVVESIHALASRAYAANPTGPSLVDRVSFEVMRSRHLTTAFAIDRHFAQSGFDVVP